MVEDEKSQKPAEEEAESDEVAPDQVESSLEEMLAKKDEGEAPPEEEAEDESMLTLERGEPVETVSVKVVPQQPTEFVCKSCFLVKHRSQLADKKRMFCRDCV